MTTDDAQILSNRSKKKKGDKKYGHILASMYVHKNIKQFINRAALVAAFTELQKLLAKAS